MDGIIQRLTVALLLGLCTSFYPPSALAQDKVDGFISKPNHQLFNMTGVWRSRGYGWVWSIGNGQIKYYDEGGRYCILRRTRSRLPWGLQEQIHVHPSGKSMRFALDELGYLYTFDKLTELPPACRTAPNPGPVSVFNAIDQIFSNHYAFFKTHNVDWAKLVRRYRPRVSAQMSDRQLFALLKDLLSNINDGHVALRAYIDGQRLRFSSGKRPKPYVALPPGTKTLPGYWTTSVGAALVGENLKQNNRGSVKYGLIDGDIGYIYIRSVGRRTRPDVDQTMDKAIRLFANATAVILDLSNNRGGYDSIGRRIVGRFARSKKIGLYKHAGDSPGDKPQAIYLEPSSRQRYLGPVFVITGKSTFSAGETMTMFLATLSNVTHIGERTPGALSDVLSKRLPNGWRVRLSNEIYLDSRRRAWESIGIPPQVFMKVRQRRFVTQDDVVAAKTAIKAIRERARAASTP